jgi:hypothetical protein
LVRAAVTEGTTLATANKAGLSGPMMNRVKETEVPGADLELCALSAAQTACRAACEYRRELILARTCSRSNEAIK